MDFKPELSWEEMQMIINALVELSCVYEDRAMMAQSMGDTAKANKNREKDKKATALADKLIGMVSKGGM